MIGIHREKTIEILETLQQFSVDVRSLLGILQQAEGRACAEQIVSSMRRVTYITQLRDRAISPIRADPATKLFDPLMAASLAIRKGDIDNAWWLTFIATHFGKHPKDGWRLARDFYGAFGQRAPWNWMNASKDKEQLFDWLENSWPRLLNDGISRRFSNHRKYESKKPSALIQVFNSYIEMVLLHRSHASFINEVYKAVGQHEHAVFDELYSRMGAVKRFGRLGSFDFLAMLGNLGIAPIAPGKAYLNGATGPLAGTKLLVFGNSNAQVSTEELEDILAQLDDRLQVGKQVLEDALCNWQKSPDKFVLFRG